MSSFFPFDRIFKLGAKSNLNAVLLISSPVEPMILTGSEIPEPNEQKKCAKRSPGNFSVMAKLPSISVSLWAVRNLNSDFPTHRASSLPGLAASRVRVGKIAPEVVERSHFLAHK